MQTVVRYAVKINKTNFLQRKYRTELNTSNLSNCTKPTMVPNLLPDN